MRVTEPPKNVWDIPTDTAAMAAEEQADAVLDTPHVPVPDPDLPNVKPAKGEEGTTAEQPPIDES